MPAKLLCSGGTETRERCKFRGARSVRLSRTVNGDLSSRRSVIQWAVSFALEGARRPRSGMCDRGTRSWRKDTFDVGSVLKAKGTGFNANDGGARGRQMSP